MLTQARARELFCYNRKTGVLSWRIPRPGIRAGTKAGCLKEDGYLVVRADKVLYRVHRVIWLYMKGYWPKVDIDHRNLVRNDNRWRNIREATRSVNAQNRVRPQANNRLGVLGVIPHGSTGRFRANICIDGRQTHLGIFDTSEQAHVAYVKAKRQHHEGCTI